jgi:hypothetical protein
MLGLFVSIVAVLPSASAGVACELEGPSCAAAEVEADVDVNADAVAAPRFATPAAIDCRVPVVSMVLQALVGECDGAARDASYRASRDPDSERSSGSLRPARRAERSTLAACTGIPSERGDAAGKTSSGQPLALFALPEPPPLQPTRFSDGATFFVPSTEPRLLERPPRA